MHSASISLKINYFSTFPLNVPSISTFLAWYLVKSLEVIKWLEAVKDSELLCASPKLVGSLLEPEHIPGLPFLCVQSSSLGPLDVCCSWQLPSLHVKATGNGI